jgi:thiol-disulfide isomerase/thioredoxin
MLRFTQTRPSFSLKHWLLGAAMSLTLASTAMANDSIPLDTVAYPDTDGKRVAMTDFKGQVVLLNFWATWCPPCVKEMPSMQRLRDRFKDQGFEVVAIAAGEDQETVTAFLPKLDTQLTFPILIDSEGTAFTDLKLRGLPMSYLVNRQGEVALTIMGGKEWDDEAQIKLIEEALKEDTPAG